MEQRTEDVNKSITTALYEAQKVCVGIFKPNKSVVWLPVIENENGVLTCITIGFMLGLSVTSHSIEAGIFIKFPEGKTLVETQNNPVAFHTWIQSLSL